MRKIFFRIFGLAVISGSLFLLASWALPAIERTKKNETFKELEIFADALTLIQTESPEEKTPKELIYGALRGMIDSLDAHSQFMTPEEYQELQVDTSGQYGGIGIEITTKDNLVTIMTVMEETPAWTAGLASYDRIVKIDETVLKNITLNEAAKMLRGKPGTQLRIVVWREKEGRLLSFDLKRAMIQLKDIKEAKILENHIAYVKLSEFREETPKELDRVLEDLKKEGMDSLILDLRNNPGGLLDKAIAVTERFLPKGVLIVSIKGKNAKQDTEFKSTFSRSLVLPPMVVLVNGGSASGSEILAGALQDHKRAIVMGASSFGKGSVQTVFPLRDGSALKLTTSRYLTPLGRIIQDAGIEPDVVVADVLQAQGQGQAEKVDVEAIFESVGDKKPQDASDQQQLLKKRYATDPQLARAVDLLKSIKIYTSIMSGHEEKARI
ncbi:MAG: S41 family peptidase [Candidatus Omnitrophota bacterium]